MNVQHSQFAANANVDKIDRLTQPDEKTQVAAGFRNTLQQQVEVTPPVYGGPQRDAINSLVDNIVVNLRDKIGELHKMLDAIDQHILTNAAKQKHALGEHVTTATHINDEIVHMRQVIAELAEQAREPG